MLFSWDVLSQIRQCGTFYLVSELNKLCPCFLCIAFHISVYVERCHKVHIRRFVYVLVNFKGNKFVPFNAYNAYESDSSVVVACFVGFFSSSAWIVRTTSRLSTTEEEAIIEQYVLLSIQRIKQKWEKVLNSLNWHGMRPECDHCHRSFGIYCKHAVCTFQHGT